MVSSNLELCPGKIKHRELLKYADEMVDLYVNQNWSTRKIALKFSTEKGAIARLLKSRGVQVHGGRTRDYSLICLDCKDGFSSKCPTRLRCGICDHKERNCQARERFRAKNAKHKLHNACIKCDASLHDMKLDRKYCDSCRSRDKHYMKYRDVLLQQCNHACVLCDNKEDLTIDHKIPLSRGGSSAIENLTILCHACNCRKGTKTLTEFEASLT